MVQPFFELLPREASTAVVATLVVLAASGAVLWIAGVKFSRFFTTLTAVGLGAVIGMNLPKWLGWQIGGAAPAVGGAVVLGVTGFALHGMWTGFLLGLTLSLWSAFITYLCVRGGQTITWPAVTETTTIASYSWELWRALPQQMSKVLPYVAAVCMITGLAFSILWTRLTTVLAWSLFGATTGVTAGLAAMYYGRPRMLSRMPSEWSQVWIMVGLVLLGTLIQWKLAPKPKKKKSSAKPPEPDGDDAD